jgi:hypothetical protein
MISYSELLSVLSLVFVLGVILYDQVQIKALKRNVECVIDSQKELEKKIEDKDKKDPYADYRNEKGLLSVKAMKEAYKNGKSRV